MDRNNPRFKDFQLVDDGSMETVIRCRLCGEVEHFQPEMPDPAVEPNWDRIDDALEMMEFQHYCAGMEERDSAEREPT